MLLVRRCLASPHFHRTEQLDNQLIHKHKLLTYRASLFDAIETSMALAYIQFESITCALQPILIFFMVAFSTVFTESNALVVCQLFVQLYSVYAYIDNSRGWMSNSIQNAYAVRQSISYFVHIICVLNMTQMIRTK